MSSLWCWRCNCSSEDKICNHIISTLFGEEARIVGCDGTLTKTIADMLAGSDVEHALHYVFKYIPNEKTYKDDLPKFSEEKLAGFLFDTLKK